MAAENAGKIRRLLFFDACMPKMENCRNAASCKNGDTLCTHRLGSQTGVIYTNGYIDFLRFSDFQVTLHFLHKIVTLQNNQQLSPDCLFFITTRDQGFLGAVRQEWEKRGRNMQLTFGAEEITAVFSRNRTKYHLKIKVIIFKLKGNSGKDVLRSLITRFNAP